jgi:hypothetical protein
VLLHGGSRMISGPHASEIAGHIYRGLYARNFFVETEADSSRRAQYVSSSSAGGSQ